MYTPFLTLLLRGFPKFSTFSRVNMDSFVWIDLEMTGLNPEKHTILEAACIVTRPDLKIVHEGIELIIHQPEEVLNSMNDWSRIQHEKSNLTSKSRESKLSLSEADSLLVDYIKQHTITGGVNYIAGSSVYMDKMFLEKHMPQTNSLLHYRIIDVSSIKILCSHWFPEEYSKMFVKKLSHRALEDIKESILELQEYQKKIFKGSDFLKD